MSGSVATPELLIDGVPVDLGHVWIHSQDDPYPGGHRYRLFLPDQLPGPWSSGRQTLSDLDLTLGLWRMRERPREAKAPRFVLNTIDKVTRAEQGVEIRGECSPHCSALKCPHCEAAVWANWLFDHCVRGKDEVFRFRCNECSGTAAVAVSGETLSLSGGGGESACRQSGLTLEVLKGKLRITLGKLKWVV